jgi:hypothetical protein
MGSGKTLPSWITAIATFHPPGAEDIIAAGTATDFNYMRAAPAGFSAPTTFTTIQGASAFTFDQYGAVWASQPTYGAVSWQNQYVSAGGYFTVDGATGVAVFP